MVTANCDTLTVRAVGEKHLPGLLPTNSEPGKTIFWGHFGQLINY